MTVPNFPGKRRRLSKQVRQATGDKFVPQAQPTGSDAEVFQPWIPGIGKLSPQDAEGFYNADAVRFEPCSLAEMPQPSESAEGDAGELESSEQIQRFVQRARQQAEAIIAEARQQAAALQQEAEERVEELLQQRAAEEAARVRREEAAKFEAAANELLDRFQQAADMTLENLAGQVATLAAGVTSKIVRRQVAADDEIILDVIADAMEQLSDIKRLRIVINPADEETISGHQAALLKHAGGLERLEIVSDDSIEPGGCLLDSDRGEVDARLSSQLEVIWKRVAGSDVLKKSA